MSTIEILEGQVTFSNVYSPIVGVESSQMMGYWYTDVRTNDVQGILDKIHNETHLIFRASDGLKYQVPVFMGQKIEDGVVRLFTTHQIQEV